MDGVGATAVGEVRAADAAVAMVSPSVYRPYLDGLRSVAVYLVVLFHSGLERFSGGYVGVDVFFVLSGFLVTQLLVRDLAGSGSIRFGRFYARRFRRLLPAAFAALIGTALLVTAVTPVKALAAIGSFKAAFLYSANWWFIRESTGYFGADVASNPVLPFWSLAVEEQFYLVWPLTLGAVFWVASRLRRRRELFVRAVVGVGALASLLWALHLRVGDPDRAYFGTDARAYQLLAGASIALVPGLVSSVGRYRRAVLVAAPLAVGSLIVLGSSVGADDAIGRGVAVTVMTAIAIVALEASPGGLAQRVLATDVLVYLGRISYGTYLWHWPVIIVATEILGLDPLGTAVFAGLVATGLASLSYHVLEQPVRVSAVLDRHRFAVIGAGLAISVVSALVLIPVIIDPAAPPGTAASVPTAAGFTPVPGWVDTRAIYAEGFGIPLNDKGEELSCAGADPGSCTLVHGTGEHVLLMGDSNALMMVPAFTAMAQENDLTLSLVVQPGCPWQRDLYVLGKDVQDECRAIKEDAYTRVIPALDPDLIVVMNAGDTADRGPTDPEHRPMDDAMAAATRASLEELAAGDRHVVVIEPNPIPTGDLDPLTCLSTAASLEDCRYLAGTDPSWYELLTREVAAGNDRVRSADLDRLVCPYLPICDPIIGGVVVKWDGQHLTTRYSRALSGPIVDYLRDAGMLSR